MKNNTRSKLVWDWNCQPMNKWKRAINTIERQVKSLTTHKPYIDCILAFHNKPHTGKWFTLAEIDKSLEKSN